MTPREQTPFRDLLFRELGGTRTLCVGMQNPSKAEADDPTVNDPTVLRVMGFAMRWGFGRLVVTNARTRRATDPKDMYAWLASLSPEEVREHHDHSAAVMIREAKRADLFIAAWGNGRADDVWPRHLGDRLVDAGVTIYALGFTNSGAPTHPLARGRNRVPDSQQPILWRHGKSASVSTNIGACLGR